MENGGFSCRASLFNDQLQLKCPSTQSSMTAGEVGGPDGNLTTSFLPPNEKNHPTVWFQPLWLQRWQQSCNHFGLWDKQLLTIWSHFSDKMSWNIIKEAQHIAENEYNWMNTTAIQKNEARYYILYYCFPVVFVQNSILLKGMIYLVLFMTCIVLWLIMPILELYKVIMVGHP